ncbi:DUF1729 domain-containing protein [Nocardioidaceae bacterium]|nr:DUF1729 domain-containing protein [Nocardioidaceae bacterium]
MSDPSTTVRGTSSSASATPFADRLTDGEPFALTFGGQGSDWLGTLSEVLDEGDRGERLSRVVERSTRILGPVTGQVAPALSRPFTPIQWARTSAPADSDAAALSVPGVLLSQIATLDLLADEGLDLGRTSPHAVAGHSQGILGQVAYAGRRRAKGEDLPGDDADSILLAMARLIGAAATITARRVGLAGGRRPEDSPMLAISGEDVAVVRELVAGVATTEGDPAEPITADTPVVSVVNGPRQVVVSGSATALARVRRAVEARAAVEAADIEAKRRGGRAFAPTLDAVATTVGFHHPAMTDAVDLAVTWANACELDGDFIAQLARAILVDPVDWPADLADVVGEDGHPESGLRTVVDLGPGTLTADLTSRVLRGRGARVLPAATRRGREQLFTPGATLPSVQDWSDHAPRLIDRGDGTPVVDTAFTRLTGTSPVLLAGMTPTTVDPEIVAAAANAGHWAELAGGGQVTEEIFAANVARLGELLEPGRTAQFNALYLDPYLWRMQVGGQRLVQKARAAGAPLDGVVVSAGVPELDDAVALVRELREAGLSHVAFKPGTVAQIRQVVAIAKALRDDDVPVIAHVEGGVAGGHHSWEDLEELLLATYADLRAVANLVVCVGGGIGTPEAAATYLTGEWATAHGETPMPVDGVLVGTAAMAVAEATTSPAVKQLLVDTPGLTRTENGGWVGAGRAAGGVVSGRSQLGADIHEIDNAAARCGVLLDEVAGDAEAVAARRDEIVAAMAATAKPYFGDLAAMTYEQLLRRYVELCFRPGTPAAGSASDAGAVEDSVWLDDSLAARFTDLLDRAVARVHPADSGEIDRPVEQTAAYADPAAAIDALVATHPEAAACVLHPADVSHVLQVFRRPGKPVPFVPVVDADVRRWWRSDSLWQAHDPAYAADAVCVIPGPVAVAGIERADEPVADLLDRFEAGIADRLRETGAVVTPAVGRTAVGDAADLLDALRASHDVVWAGRTVTNPLHRLAGAGRVELVAGEERETAEITVPLSRGRLRLRVDLTDVRTGGLPVISDDAATAAMGELLSVTAGGSLPELVDSPEGPTATWTTTWRPGLVADHVGVTDPVRRRPTDGEGTEVVDPAAGAVPDALLGLAWPATFAAIGPVEGLLDLVHADHTLELAPGVDLTRIPDGTEIRVRATRTATETTTAGRLICVEVTFGHEDALLATAHERFLVRGRSGLQGAAEVTAPPSVTDGAVERPRTKLDRFTVDAPVDMAGFASVTGDHNPLHTETAAARLAGFDAPIAHGMWLSAVGQHAAAGVDATRAPRPVRAWSVRWTAPLALGAAVEVTVERTGVRDGDTVLEVSARVDGELVMLADAVVAAPRTAYAFPGQGIQSQGMGLEARSRSAAAREVWDRADAHTRARLGFSILAVVRDNPVEMLADGATHRHPDGVLFLTQFTQVAMATLAVAQVAELREAGVFVEDAVTCGHSVGEYNALAAVTGTLPLESLLEIVFRRGMSMHALVPRDAQGRSNYRLAAIRPAQAGLSDEEVTDFVAGVAAGCDEFLQIVNYNLRGSQYAVAGTIAGLEVLEAAIEKRRAEHGGKAAYVLVPGIDVPFHSSELHDGVADFRRHLEDLLPEDMDVTPLVGRYVPNLVPKPFALDKAYVAEVAATVDSEVLAGVLKRWKTWSRTPLKLGRALLVELLAWQFASPVRWIETQDLLFADADGVGGGLGVERFIEVGVADAPTLANLATKTVALDSFTGTTRPAVLNSSRDAAVVLATDERTLPEEPSETAEETLEAVGTTTEAAPAPSPSAVAPAAPAAEAGAPRPADLSFDAADATAALVALRTKVRPDQIGSADTIEALCDGVSSRRNQLLVDLGAELNLGAIDGAAEADWKALAGTVNKLARTYTAFGPVLTEASADALRSFAGSKGAKPQAIADHVTGTWQLGAGWVSHVVAELTLGLRDGTSARGGDLGYDASVLGGDLAAVVDHAVGVVASAQGVAVAKPAASTGGGATVDSAALAEITDAITGADGVLAGTARDLLGRLGLADHGHGPDVLDETPDSADLDAELARLVETELGSDWARAVTGTFDERRAVLLDDRWASVREDLARAWHHDDTDGEVTARCFTALDEAAATQARWWLDRARAAQRTDLVSFYGRVLAEADTSGEWAGETAVVTGAAPGSIAAAVVADLLRGGACVVATTSRLDARRLAFFKQLYRDHAAVGAALWVLPANLASFADVDALTRWITSPVTETAGGARTEVRPALAPTLVFPFAAPGVQGSAADAGPTSEVAFRVLVWGVERLVTGLGAAGADHRVGSRIHVVLPGSPNRGRFGGDGAYGEAKAAFDAFCQRWNAETAWAARTSLVHAHIGWVRGTGLMGHNDPLVDAVTEAGVRTWSPAEMAAELLTLCDPRTRDRAAGAPVTVDLTGGLGEVDLDLAALARDAHTAERTHSHAEGAQSSVEPLLALTHPAGWGVSQPTMPDSDPWPETTARPEDLVVVVGAGELGPIGSSRTRFELEVEDALSPAGVLELAWTTGLITWENDPEPGWSDSATGELLTEAEVVERFAEQVTDAVGIRPFRDDNALQDGTAPLVVPVYLDEDTSFTVRTEDEARALLASDPDHTRIAPDPGSSDWRVTRLAGSEIRVPRRFKLSRHVGAQVPDGFDPAVWGLGHMVGTTDRLAAWNLVATVDAFVSSGVTPAEMLRWIHPTRFANTQGTGIGGMESTRKMYVDAMLGEKPPNDVLQEALPNVIAAHTVQAYLGGYGSMVHPVAACATAAVSVEEGVDKIRLDKADVVVTGGFDDLGLEGILGFGSMSATADTDQMLGKGIEPAHVSRPNDRRRGGFVEGQGGGTVVLARGDVALRMGLPVLGVVAYAGSFADGIHTSIPAPGLGAMGAGIGGTDSPLARGLASVGLGADDVAVVSKHDTSTAANDPNESRLHEALAGALGRSAGAPMYVVSQKSLTGHAKGGAAAFQLIGLSQLLTTGTIPPNRSLDCVDAQLAENPHLVWLRETLRTGPLRAGLVTSLGFGHVSALIALAHPAAFAATLTDAERETWLVAASERLAAGERRRQEAMCGGEALFTRVDGRRFDDADQLATRRDEQALLLDPAARLGEDGTYPVSGA